MSQSECNVDNADCSTLKRADLTPYLDRRRVWRTWRSVEELAWRSWWRGPRSLEDFATSRVSIHVSTSLEYDCSMIAERTEETCRILVQTVGWASVTLFSLQLEKYRFNMGSMPNSEDCTGLMAFWADIDADYLLRYQQWHNCEHIPERVSIPGFVEGRRYRALDDRPHFLMFYETQTTSVLASDAYMAALNQPTPWTREALSHFRNPTRDIFTRLAVVGSRKTSAAPYITSLRFDLPEGAETETDYVGRWVNAAAEIKQVERVRLYKVDAAIGNMATSERKVHGGGPGKQTYLVLIEESVPPTAETDPVRRADAVLGGGVQRENEDCQKYWLEMAHRI